MVEVDFAEIESRKCRKHTLCDIDIEYTGI